MGTPAVLENLFPHKGVPGHEIVFPYPVHMEAGHLHARDEFKIDDGRGTYEAFCAWRPVEGFLTGKLTLSPDGLKDVVTELLPPA